MLEWRPERMRRLCHLWAWSMCNLQYIKGISMVIRPNLTTDLLVLCGPSIAAQKLIESFRTRTSLPASLVMGYDYSKKEYSTSKLKTYPAPFCHALARPMGTWICTEWSWPYVGANGTIPKVHCWTSTELQLWCHARSGSSSVRSF